MVRFAPHVAVTLHVRETASVYKAGSADLDVEALEALEEEITIMAAHLHAGDHRLLTLVAEFDRLRGWELGGHRTCAHWLAFRIGLDLGAAREKVRAARVLVDLPETSASMSRGELSFSAVRALTRVATPENEGDLLDLARGCTTAQLERMVRAWKLGSRQDEADRERERIERRSLSMFPDEDGMVVVRARLTPEQGAL
ncbi:MAG: 13E12 repeat family protein, partial [Gemmatimonadetes bacterium]|nr:13E12 repeat family protein [Gemmatimonadota bacterium]